MASDTRPCDLCFMNPPCNMTVDGDVTFLPVPEALPDDTLCVDCREQCDSWERDEKRHREENHQAPWEHNCEMCSLNAYAEDRDRAWKTHLTRCEECRTAPHDFVGPPPLRCRECGAEAGKVPSDEMCLNSYTREMHRDNC